VSEAHKGKNSEEDKTRRREIQKKLWANPEYRKKQIENLPPEMIQRVNLTVSVNKQKQDMFDAVNKIIENS
jgi:hypothetical protein